MAQLEAHSPFMPRKTVKPYRRLGATPMPQSDFLLNFRALELFCLRIIYTNSLNDPKND